MDLIPIECGSCKAKLKIKASPSRMPTQVKCPKCGSAIDVGKSTGATASSAPTQQPAPPPMPAPVPPPTATAASSTAELTPPPKLSDSSTATGPVTNNSVAAPKKAAAPIVIGQVSDASAGTTIIAKCPNCQWQTKVSTTLEGKKIRCKQCSGVIFVAAQDASAPSAPTPSLSTSPSPEIPPALPKIPTPPQPVAPLSPTPPVPTTHSIQENAELPHDVHDLRAKLEAARQVTAAHLQKLNETEIRLQAAEALAREADRRIKSAETRAQEAETAIHDLAGKNAVETISANRRIAELEAQMTDMNTFLETLLNEYKAELAVNEKRSSVLRERIAHLTS